jgi:hypothetical protein
MNANVPQVSPRLLPWSFSSNSDETRVAWCRSRYCGTKRRTRCTLALFRLASVFFAMYCGSRGSEHSIDRDHPQPEVLRPFLPARLGLVSLRSAEVKLKSRDPFKPQLYYTLQWAYSIPYLSIVPGPHHRVRKSPI